MPQRQNKKTLSLIILLIWVAGLGFAALNRQTILDWLALRGYQAPAVISQQATQDTFTPYARKIFYVNHPAVADKTNFSKSCPSGSKQEQTIVLGCYHSNQAGIYLLQVTDIRLNGVEQVTSAHEMLHAAYDRLSGEERQQINGMLTDYYNHDMHDPRILSTLAAYKRTEPNDVVNEMHSVFGTEIANLPNGLEQYYKRYFNDRSRITAYASQYQTEFTSRQTIVAADDAQLTALKKQINNDEANLKTSQTQLASLQNQLESERGNSPNAYNAAVPAYNSKVDAFNSEVRIVQGLIAQYNQLVISRNSVALEEDQLINDLSGSPNPIHQQ